MRDFVIQYFDRIFPVITTGIGGFFTFFMSKSLQKNKDKKEIMERQWKIGEKRENEFLQKLCFICEMTQQSKDEYGNLKIQASYLGISFFSDIMRQARTLEKKVKAKNQESINTFCKEISDIIDNYQLSDGTVLKNKDQLKNEIKYYVLNNRKFYKKFMGIGKKLGYVLSVK